MAFGASDLTWQRFKCTYCLLRWLSTRVGRLVRSLTTTASWKVATKNRAMQNRWKPTSLPWDTSRWINCVVHCVNQQWRSKVGPLLSFLTNSGTLPNHSWFKFHILGTFRLLWCPTLSHFSLQAWLQLQTGEFIEHQSFISQRIAEFTKDFRYVLSRTVQLWICPPSQERLHCDERGGGPGAVG